MKVGTKSVLFGVHQFIWHPLTVAMAWRRLYGASPRWHEWVSIFLHDVGYWGCPDMDGERGKKHPIFGAELASRVVFNLECLRAVVRHPMRALMDEGFGFERWLAATALRSETYRLCIGHSRFFAKKYGTGISKLFAADKACIFHDPIWFYLIRAKASGELAEYMRNSGLPSETTPQQWRRWYESKVKNLL